MEDFINKIYQGDCLEVMKGFQDNSIDTIITDPPYGLSFMGKKWDYDVPSIDIWKECLRVLKPGGTALIFAGSRTQHRMACNVEDAGFELFDTIMYMYGSGFPKSHNIKKALIKKCSCGNMEEYEKTKQKTKYYLRPMSETDISQTKHLEDKQREVLLNILSQQKLSSKDKTEGVLFVSEREGEPCLEGGCNILQKEGKLYRCPLCKMSREVFTDGKKRWIYYGTQIDNGETSGEITEESGSSSSQRPQSKQQPDRKPCSVCQQFLTQEARSWNGWGTALKPAYEPIICARKPVEKTYANNALKNGVAGLNIDESRIKIEGKDDRSAGNRTKTFGKKEEVISGGEGSPDYVPSDKGRFPANIILDEEAGKMLDEQSGNLGGGKLKTGSVRKKQPDNCYKLGFTQKDKNDGQIAPDNYGDKGGASRFFYCAKASKSERNDGCEELDEKNASHDGRDKHIENAYQRHDNIQRNNHPTVKPLKLMEYLSTLTKTPTGGVVLDPFAGSGTTGVACQNTDRDFILIEMTPEYIPIIEARTGIKCSNKEEVKEEIKPEPKIDKCKCGGRLIKLKSGLTCEDCLTDY